ncbi:hypothetical protein OAJ74_02745 [Alphaproteobacteria bacterium]|nr:hypothetical protein [Alphaproteobacteria bacterium]
MNISQPEHNKVYFSKNTHLWKHLNKKKNSININFCRFEKRIKISDLGKKILFCLPPSIGLGDAIEYGLAIKSIINSNKFNLVGVVFPDRYEKIFQKYFEIINVYGNIILEESLLKYDTIFHTTLEIGSFKNQKYSRSNIEKNIIKKFNVTTVRNYKSNLNTNKKIKKITIFPISQSPIRSMPIKLLNSLIENFNDNFKIDLVFDNSSKISKYLEKHVCIKDSNKLHPSSLWALCKVVEKTEFGVFMDSGPLHLAKILGKKGILVITSVSGQILLDDFSTIKEIKNDYKSNYCISPCGLTNVFNYENKVGCYQNLSIEKSDLFKKKLNLLQRGSIKNSYVNLMKHPVGCVKNLNINKINQSIKKILE